MNGRGDENPFDGIADKPECLHRALQLCREQDVFACGVQYVCGKCSKKFVANPLETPKREPREPMFPKHIKPWGTRGRQA